MIRQTTIDAIMDSIGQAQDAAVFAKKQGAEGEFAKQWAIAEGLRKALRLILDLEEIES